MGVLFAATLGQTDHMPIFEALILLVLGTIATLWPGTLMTFGPFGKTRLYQRIAQSRPLMMMARLGGAVAMIVGALSLWQAFRG